MDDSTANAVERKRKERRDVVIDGRTARRHRNRDAVLDALIALADEGHIDPPIEAIADRAGVSYRSVYRYFEDRTALMLAAMERMLDDLWPTLHVESPGVGEFDDRVAGFVTSRVAAYRRLAPLTRQVRRLRLTEPAVAAQDDRIASYIRERLEEQFAAELGALPADERKVTLAALEVTFQFAALEHLSQHLGLGDAEIVEVLAHQLRINLASVTGRR